MGHTPSVVCRGQSHPWEISSKKLFPIGIRTVYKSFATCRAFSSVSSKARRRKPASAQHWRRVQPMPFLIRSVASSLTLLTIFSPLAHAADPPKTWIDKDTGHRVWRISDEPNSGAYYFNVNAYTPDWKQMVYNSPDGIRVLDLDTMKTKMLVPNVPPAP